MLRIRLRRAGRKNRPTYRIVVAEHSAPLAGKFVAMLGHFDPRTKAVGLQTDDLLKWLGVGAKPSNRVAKILTAAGMTHKHVVVVQRAERKPRKAAAASAPQAALAAEAASELVADSTGEVTGDEPATEAVTDEAAAEPASTKEAN